MDIVTIVFSSILFLSGCLGIYIAVDDKVPAMLVLTMVAWSLTGLFMGLMWADETNKRGIQHDLKEQQFTVRSVDLNTPDGIKVKIDRDSKIFTCLVTNDNEDHYWIIENLDDCNKQTKAKVKAVKPEGLK